jgi:LL-diaminopimelate aminotransferase
VDFARLHHIVVVHDAAYAALVYPPHRPLSFLSIPGAKDVGVEVHSLSKSFNMTGWRLGFVAGNAEAVSAFAAVKDTADSGQFRAIQKAGEACLMTAGLTEEALARYERRFDLLVPALRSLGFDAKKSPGTFYCYVRAPMSAEDASGLVRFPTAESFSTWLVSRFLISTVPWDDAGSYVRFSVTF